MTNSEWEEIAALLDKDEQEQCVPEYSNANLGSSDDGCTVFPKILVTGRPTREISDDSLAALQQANTPPSLFVRSGNLVYISTDERDRHIIKAVEPAYLRGRMDRSADYIRQTKSGKVQCSPQKDVVADILALEPRFWPFPRLETLVEIPILLPDGTVLSDPGYHWSSALFYKPLAGLQVPPVKDRPNRTDLQHALAVLDDAIGEFPYEDDAGRANTLALLLTPIVRHLIDGPVPLALIDAPQAGTGKTLLTEIVALITTGVAGPMTAAPREEEEWRKSITATLYQGTSVIIYDNLDRVLQSSSLAMALTATQWKDRILGLSQMATLPQMSTWIVTGNNIRLGGDLPRRCYWIRLDSKTSQPWKRSGFRHPDLLSWVKERQGDLLAALLTLARAYFAAGCPAASVPRIGGFDAWSKTVGGILAHAEVPAFLSNLEGLYELLDDTTPQWESFLEAVYGAYRDEPFTVAQLTDILASGKVSRECLPDELNGAWRDKEAPSASFKVRLGKSLKGRIQTRYGSRGLHLESAGTESRGGRIMWRVRAGVQGSQG